LWLAQKVLTVVSAAVSASLWTFVFSLPLAHYSKQPVPSRQIALWTFSSSLLDFRRHSDLECM
jgi:hypothetical protein